MYMDTDVFKVLMKRFIESPFKTVYIESKNGMVLVIRVKIVFEVIDKENGIQMLKPKERVWKILKGELDSEILPN